MLIPLNEPNHFRYIHINPETNRVHLLIPFIAGIEISTDNTCKSDVELEAFFNGGAFKELDAYKKTLEFHLSLLEENNPHYLIKKKRRDQLHMYIKAVVSMRDRYKTIVNNFLRKPSNLYSIQLRPYAQDPMSYVVNPVFTINRENDSRGRPLSPLYNMMHDVFPKLMLGKPDPRTDLIDNLSKILPQEATFEDIKHALKAQCAKQFNINIDVESWIRPIPGEKSIKSLIDKAHIDEFMGFSEKASSKDYIDALLGICAPNLWRMIDGSPFYLGIYDNSAHQTESLSMMTQFYLGVLNVYCRAQGISDSNFGMILDSSPALSQKLIDVVAATLDRGENVEPAFIAFFNHHNNEFKLSRKLNVWDNRAIAQKFESTYRTVTATKENPHMDDFMFLDTQAQGKQNVFITHKGLICTDAAYIIPETPQNYDYLAEIRQEARMYRDMVTPQDEAIITIDVEPIVLINKLNDVQLEQLPKNVIDACYAEPTFKVRELLDHVAKGKQDHAHAMLELSEDKQTLLKTPGNFTDYSGRTFHCTAYEYAYWAKDTHMQRMLERHMDDETKAIMLSKIDDMEQVGLPYQQHGIDYQNAHYDMSFILKNLNPKEFRKLQTMVGHSSAKLQQATIDNYKNISFTATEYEALKKRLKRRHQKGFYYFFDSSPAKILKEKLNFDFNSLITALDSYVNDFNSRSYHQKIEAWMRVGKAQRDVPAHIANEYCRLDRAFSPLPSFKEDVLPRVLTFYNNVADININHWFPLSEGSSGLGFDFAVIRRAANGAWLPWRGGPLEAAAAMIDLTAAQHLDEVRLTDITQSRENLSRRASQLELVN